VCLNGQLKVQEPALASFAAGTRLLCLAVCLSTGGMQYSSFRLAVQILNVCAQAARAAQLLCHFMDSNMCPYFMFGVGFVLT
jgi:hypothetical protein